jgi:uncharacterized protein (TIGR00725 family)
MRNVIAVIGGGSCAPEDYARAREVGRLLAEQGYAVLTGGLGGVMEAAHRGAREADGLTIAVLPGSVAKEANPYAEIVILTGMGDARNVIVATSGRAVIAVGGSLGTLSEIALALKHNVPVIGLGSWTLPEHRVTGHGVMVVDTPEKAMHLVDGIITQGSD